MARDLATLPIETIEYRDIQDLIGAEEGISLEFKRTLSTNDGQPDRWFRDQSAIGRAARDDIAKEIVAFANAYGGIIVIGIDETDDNPKRAEAIHATHIPRVQDCAEQFVHALRGVIDPPLSMLDVRGIVSTDDAGLIVFRVGASPSAPHGVGTPPAAYVRRGAASVPLTMRDQQSMFFERRTQIERLETRRREQSAEAHNMWDAFHRGRLQKPRENAPFNPGANCVLFRCSFTSSANMDINNFPDRFSGLNDAPRPVISSAAPLIKWPYTTAEYVRRYRAVEHADSAGDRRYWRVAIEADGLIDQRSIVVVDEDARAIYPSWYVSSILSGMVIGEWMRRWAGRPDVEYILDGEFIKHGDPVVCRSADFQEYERIPWSDAKFGPYSVASRSSFAATFDLIEREILDLFGIPRRAERLIGPMCFIRSACNAIGRSPIAVHTMPGPKAGTGMSRAR